MKASKTENRFSTTEIQFAKRTGINTPNDDNVFIHSFRIFI